MTRLPSPEKVAELRARCEESRAECLALRFLGEWNVIVPVLDVEAAALAAELLPGAIKALERISRYDPNSQQALADLAARVRIAAEALAKIRETCGKGVQP